MRYLHNWKWFVLSVGAFMFMGAFYLFIAQPKYEVYANILIKKEESAGLSAMKNFSFGFPGSMDVHDELLLLSSRSVMRQAVKDLDLYTSYQEVKYLIKKQDVYGARAINLDVPASVADTLHLGMSFKIAVSKDGRVDVSGKNFKGEKICDIKDATFPVSVVTPYGDFALAPTSHFIAHKSYRYNVTVFPLDVMTEAYQLQTEIGMVSKKANVIALSLAGNCVDRQKALLDELIKIYNRDAMLDKNLVSANTAEFIESRLNILDEELRQAEVAIEEYKKEHGLFNLEVESTSLLELSNLLEPRYIEVSSQMMFVNQMIRTLESGADYTLLPTSVGVQDESAAKGIESYNEAILSRIKLVSTTTPENPMLQVLDTKIAAMKENVLISLYNVQNSLEILQGELGARRDQFSNRLVEAPTIEKEFLTIKRNQLIKEKLVLFLMEKREANSLTLAVTAPKAKVIDDAYSMIEPVSPKKLVILVLCLLMGLITPVAYFYLVDLFRNTFSTREELESILGMRLLGEVCRSDKGERIVISKNNVTPIAELFKAIRNGLGFILKKTEKVIMVTSTTSGEGKSFVSINLALSLALTHKKVVLVGLDLRNPRLFDYMDLEGKNVGVSNYLTDESLSHRDIIISNFQQSGLDLISAGPIPPNPSELLLEERLDQLIESLKSEYDYVIIDSAPVGIISDSFSLTRFIDMTLYVMRANYSPISSANMVKHLVADGSLKRVYVILNDTDLRQSTYGYGYGQKKKK